MKTIMNKRAIAFIMVCTLLMQCVGIPTSLAAGGMSVFVTMDNYVAGEQITVMWYTDVDGADHYDCTVLNQTTGTYPRPRSTSSSGYDCYVSGNKVEAGNYKVWVGAVDANGDVIDDGYAYFTVNEATSCDHQWSSRTGTCKLCGEECPHNNGVYEIETASKGVSISDTKHRIIYTYDEECKICRYVLNADLTKEDTGKHSFDSNGDCVLCDYRATCKHTNTTYVVIEGYPAYHYYDENEHTADTQFKEVCLDCDKVVQYPVDSERIYVYEAHDFDGSGKCTKCSYVKPEAQEELAISVSESTSTAEVGATIGATASATGGDGNYSFAWKVTCNGSAIADTDLSYGSYYSVTANEVGSYVFTAVVRDGNGNQKSASSGTISVAEPACKHLTTDVAWDTSYDIHYKSISDSEHEMTGYQYQYCTECLQRIGDSYAVTKNYGHDFDASGDCPTCGYTYACPHTNTTYVVIEGYPAYHYYDEDEHTADTQFKEVCLDCDKVVQYPVDSERIYVYEAHDFDDSGKCTKCGYVKPEEQEELAISVIENQTTANTGDTIYAKATITGGSGSYSIGWTVVFDDTEIDQTDMSMGDMYSYLADKAGSYVFTAIVQDSAGNTQTASSGAIVVKVAHNWKTVTSTEIINQSVKIHDIVTTTYEECTICGEKTEPVVTTQSVEHVIIRTSYESAHPHQKFNVCRDCSAHPPIEGQYHTVNNNNKPQSAEKCCICHGHVWQTNELDEVNGEWREYCLNCGRYRTVDAPVEENNCDHIENRAAKSPAYSQYNESHHIKSVEVIYSCTCGQVYRSETEFSTERHAVSNGQCTLCYYVVDPYENNAISNQRKEDLISESESIIADTFTTLAQEKESDATHQIASEALKIITSPIGGTIDAASGGIFGAQEKEVLQRAVVEMLYGVEYGNTTFTELSQLVDATGTFVGDFAFNVLSSKVDSDLSQVQNVLASKAESFEYAFSVYGYDMNEIAQINLNNVSSRQIDELIATLQNYSYPEGTEQYIKQQKVIEDLTDWKQLSPDREYLANTKTNVDVASLGFEGIVTVVTTILNHHAASETVDKTLQSQNEALYAVASDRVQKIEILSMLMESLDEDSALYDACKQVRKDIQNNLVGLSSVDQREAVYENGKAWIEFGCDITLATEVGSTAAGGIVSNILVTSALGTVISNGLTAGGISDAVDYSESLENLTFIHNALLSINQENMGFYETELYYTLAKKQLDYASEINMLMHTDSWLSRQDEEEKLYLDMDIVKAQRDLLNAQNEIRAEYYANNGIAFKAENGFDAGVISKYLLAKYDLVVGNEEIPAYANIDAIGATGELQPVRLFDWKLDKNSKYEITAVLEKDGVDYLEVEDTKGNVSYVRVLDIPNGRRIVEEKYSLHIKAGTYIPVYLVKDTGFIGDVSGTKDFMYRNSDYANGDYEIIRVVQYNEEYYYQVRDTRGSEWYLKAEDIQDYLQ